MRLRTLFALLAVVASAAFGLAACGGDDDNAADAPAPVQMESAAVTDAMAMGAADTDTPAADLRVTLDTLLGEHALLALATAQKGYDGAPDFEAEATGLPQAALQEGLTMHITQLKGAIDAYAAGDYEQAYTLTREAYDHMVATGDTLAAAIVQQSPDAFEG
jgi:hypothetical protein